jgi:hypothetical protein
MKDRLRFLGLFKILVKAELNTEDKLTLVSQGQNK